MDAAPSPGNPRNEAPLSSSVLVLNRNYAAIRVITARRAFALLYRDCAQVVDTREESFDVMNFARWVDCSTAGGVGHAGPILGIDAGIVEPRSLPVVIVADERSASQRELPERATWSKVIILIINIL